MQGSIVKVFSPPIHVQSKVKTRDLIQDKPSINLRRSLDSLVNISNSNSNSNSEKEEGNISSGSNNNSSNSNNNSNVASDFYASLSLSKSADSITPTVSPLKSNGIRSENAGTPTLHNNSGSSTIKSPILLNNVASSLAALSQISSNTLNASQTGQTSPTLGSPLGNSPLPNNSHNSLSALSNAASIRSNPNNQNSAKSQAASALTSITTSSTISNNSITQRNSFSKIPVVNSPNFPGKKVLKVAMDDIVEVNNDNNPMDNLSALTRAANQQESMIVSDDDDDEEEIRPRSPKQQKIN
jgi:hypothetical protein